MNLGGATTCIAVLSHKGGVGKTMTVANLGPALAGRGLRVLMVDWDPQADLSASWGIEADDEAPRVEDLLDDSDPDVDGALLEVTPASWPGRLYLLACGSELRRHTARLLGGRGDELAGLLDVLGTPVDLVLIDTPAGETIFGAQAIVAAQETIVTLLPGYHELRAVTRVLDSIDGQSEAAGTDLALLGVLVVNADQRWRTTRDYREHLFAQELPVFSTIVPRRQGVTGHARYGRPTVLLEPGNAVAHAYHRVAEEIAARLVHAQEAGR